MKTSRKNNRGQSRTDANVALVVKPLGRVAMIQYIDAKGRRKVHLFNRGETVSRTRDGRHLIIEGVTVKNEEIQ